MFIYAIGTDTKQKIGYSHDPDQRLKTLQTSNPETLTIQYVFEVDESKVAKFEKYIHKEQCHRHLRGEWFDMSKKEVTDLMIFYEISSDSISNML